MQMLVFNCGSSSQNYKLYQWQNESLILVAKGKAHRVGVTGSEPSFIEHSWNGQVFHTEVGIPDHATAANLILDFLQEHHFRINAIGHRFVHGGELFQKSILLTPQRLEQLQQVIPLAPIHNPNSLSVIRVCLQRFPACPQTLTFDTAFHSGLPESAYRYAIPESAFKMGIRKFGFHGLSYQYVTTKAAEYLRRPLSELSLVACHLGTGGSSVCAIENGRSRETSMGYTPLAGLMMSTRSGDLDAGVVLAMLQEGKNSDQISGFLNKKSGLLGVSGFSSDIRDSLNACHKGENNYACLAVEMYAQRLIKIIGAYLALMGGADGLIFTDDIGLQNPEIRVLVCNGLEWCGLELDREANLCAPLERMSDVSTPQSKIRVLVTPTDEEAIIAEETRRLLVEGSLE